MSETDQLTWTVPTYFSWLVDRIDGVGRGYDALLEALFRVDYFWILPSDENRAIDGVELRGDGEFRYSLGPCSVLEMLVGLSIRIENDIMMDIDNRDRTAKWFWMMVGNLTLDRYDNAHYDSESVHHILENWMSGDGNVRLFPSKNESDNKEIWYQMQEFLVDFE